MKASRFPVIVAILCLAAFATSQSPSPYVRIFEGKGRTAGEFVDDKTLVVAIEYAGLDDDQRDYGVYLEEPIYEKSFISELQFRKVGLKVDEPFAAYKAHQTEKLLKEWLDQNGYPRASVKTLGQMTGEARMRLKFEVERGEPLKSAELVFNGNEHVPSAELREDFEQCSKGRGFSKQMLEYCAQKHSRSYMWTKGFFKAKINDVSFSLRKSTRLVNVTVYEGPLYRVGDIKTEGNNVLSESEILTMYGQYPGDIIDGRKLQTLVYEQLKSKYGELGYVHYDAEFEPVFIDPVEKGLDGIVNVLITMNEGRRFSIRTIRFVGVEESIQKALISEFPLKSGEVFVHSKFVLGIDQINKSGKFGFLDKDGHVEIRTDEATGDLDLHIKIKQD